MIGITYATARAQDHTKSISESLPFAWASYPSLVCSDFSWRVVTLPLGTIGLFRVLSSPSSHLNFCTQNGPPGKRRVASVATSGWDAWKADPNSSEGFDFSKVTRNLLIGSLEMEVLTRGYCMHYSGRYRAEP